jgi:hypothetical protein
LPQQVLYQTNVFIMMTTGTGNKKGGWDPPVHGQSKGTTTLHPETAEVAQKIY